MRFECLITTAFAVCVQLVSFQAHAATDDPEFDWAVVYGNYWADGSSIATDSQGNILVAGFFFNSDDLDPGSETAPVSADLMGAYVVKLDSDGNYLWSRSFNDIAAANSTFDWIQSITVDSNDNVIAMGLYEGTVDFNPGPSVASRNALTDGSLFILKLDTNGDFVWVRTTNGQVHYISEAPRSIAVDENDAVLVAYYVGAEARLLKLSAAGAVEWSRSVGGSGANRGIAVATDGANNVYFAGTFAGTADLDPTSGVDLHTSTSAKDMFIVKLSSDGEYLWSGDIGGGELSSIAALPNGSVYVCGETGQGVDLDPGPGIHLAEHSGIMVLKLNAIGDFIWGHGLGSGDPNDIVVRNDGTVYIAGDFSGEIDFNPGAGVASEFGNPPSLFALKLNSNGSYIWHGVVNSSGATALAVDHNESLVFSGWHAVGNADFDMGSGTFNLPLLGAPSVALVKMTQEPRAMPLDFAWVLAGLSVVGVISVARHQKRTTAS